MHYPVVNFQSACALCFYFFGAVAVCVCRLATRRRYQYRVDFTVALVVLPGSVLA